MGYGWSKGTKPGVVWVGFEVHGHGQVGTTVIGVVKYSDLATTGVLAGNLDCVLNSFGT
jgi:hypothetical protein